jgi:hypothetical protein
LTPQWLYHLIGEKVPSSTGFVGFSAKQSDQSNFTGQIRNGDLSGSTQNPPKSQSWGPQNSNFTIVYDAHVGVSINGGTPQWMVYIMENTIKMDDLGVPLQETSIYPSGQMFRGSPDNKTSRASSGSLGLGPLEESRFCVFHFCGSYL